MSQPDLPLAPKSPGLEENAETIKGKVMREKSKNRDKWLHIRVTTDEFNKLKEGFSHSTKRKRSEYLRSLLLHKSITVFTRNQSLDDFMAEMILLRNELKAIGNNFNQAVKKLHTLDHDGEIKTWAKHNEKHKEFFFQKVNEIQARINKISDQWLHA